LYMSMQNAEELKYASKYLPYYSSENFSHKMQHLIILSKKYHVRVNSPIWVGLKVNCKHDLIRHECISPNAP